MAESRIMTWNVQDLLEIGRESGPWSAAQLSAKIASLGAVVDGARPRVLTVQEVGIADVMDQFRTALTWKLPHLALGRPDARGISTGCDPTRVIRDPIDATAFPPGLLPVQTPDERARFGADASKRRSSTTVRQWMNAAIDDRGDAEPFVLLGGMNDEVDAGTTQILDGPTGSEIGTRGFDTWLFEPARLVSRRHRGRGELIDHVFASRFPRSPPRRSRRCRRMQADAGPLPSIDDDPTDADGHLGSDHAAVLATSDYLSR